MTIKKEIQLLERSALIELFVLDSTNIPGGDILRFHAGTNKLTLPVVWQGYSYEPLPVEASGFDISSQGVMPRPKMRIANIGGLLSAEIKRYDDFVGSKVIRKRTFAKYLDAVNYPNALNETADPNQFIPDDIWYVEQKMTETRHVIEFELASAFDLVGVQLPSRQVIQNSCPWSYRGGECGYTGSGFDLNNNPTVVPANDVCMKTISSCKVRFKTSPLRFGGFPGATRSAK